MDLWLNTHLLKFNKICFRVSELEFPAVDIFVTTADAILEPSIITMNTVLSLLAVDYPANKLALYLSDDGCSPLTLYSLIEATKFAKLWVPFCKKYNIQTRAPFRYFTSNSTPVKDDSLEFQQEWKKMKVVIWNFRKIKHSSKISLLINYFKIIYQNASLYFINCFNGFIKLQIIIN